LSLSTLADKYCPTVCRPVLNRVQQSLIGKRIVSGTFWSVIGNGFGKMFTFIAMVFVARILGTQLYGELGLIRSVTDIFIGLSSFGVGTAATKYIAELLENDKQRVGRIIGLCYVFTLLTCIFAAIILYFAAPFVCESSMVHAPHLTGELRISIVMLIFMTFMGSQIGVMSGFQDFRGLAFANFIGGLISIPLYVGGSYYYGLYGAIIGMGMAALANVVVNSIFIYRNTSKYHVRYYFKNAWYELPILWKLSLPTFLSGIIFSIFTAIYRLMLAATPNGFDELGVYIAVAQIEIIVYFIPVQISAVILPLLSEQHGKRNNKKVRQILNLSIVLNMVVSLVFVLPIILFSKQIMLLFGEGYVGGYRVLVVICMGIVFHAASRALYSEFISQNRMWLFLGTVILFCLFQLVLVNYFLSNGLGAWGMAIAYTSAQTFCFILLFLISRIHLINTRKDSLE
jgi:O-antigen/teichoic acid export membrane protein